MAQAVAARVGGQTKKKQTGWGRPAVPPPSRGRGIATARRGLCVAHKRVVRVGCFVYTSSVNDPSAGSPTETLLRLLLPLDEQIYRISVSTPGRNLS